MPTTTKQVERRNFKKLEFRAATKDAANSVGTITGYAAVFNSLSQEMWGMVEQIAPGAFKVSLDRGDDVRALFNHDDDLLLARRSSGTLTLKEDSTGLAVEINVPDTQVGRDVRELVLRGDLDGMSFGFITVKDSWTKQADGRYLRTLDQVDLFDVGPVTYPAYLATTAEARSMIEAMMQQRARPSPPTFTDAARAERDRLIAQYQDLRSIWT